jgi:hypothetical protein
MIRKVVAEPVSVGTSMFPLCDIHPCFLNCIVLLVIVFENAMQDMGMKSDGKVLNGIKQQLRRLMMGRPDGIRQRILNVLVYDAGFGVGARPMGHGTKDRKHK